MHFSRHALLAGIAAAFMLIAFDVSPAHAAPLHEAAGSCTLPGSYETAMEAGFHSLHARRERREQTAAQGM